MLKGESTHAQGGIPLRHIRALRYTFAHLYRIPLRRNNVQIIQLLTVKKGILQLLRYS